MTKDIMKIVHQCVGINIYVNLGINLYVISMNVCHVYVVHNMTCVYNVLANVHTMNGKLHLC